MKGVAGWFHSAAVQRLPVPAPPAPPAEPRPAAATQCRVAAMFARQLFCLPPVPGNGAVQKTCPGPRPAQTVEQKTRNGGGACSRRGREGDTMRWGRA